LKIISCQIEILGQEYLNLLKKEGLLLKDLMEQLFKVIDNKSKESKEVIPLQWIEARIQNIRKMATESTKTIKLAKAEV